MIPNDVKRKIESYSDKYLPKQPEVSISIRAAEYGYSLAQEAYDKLYADFKQVCEYDENLREENKRYRNAYNEAQKEIENLKVELQRCYEALDSRKSVNL